MFKGDSFLGRSPLRRPVGTFIARTSIDTGAHSLENELARVRTIWTGGAVAGEIWQSFRDLAETGALLVYRSEREYFDRLLELLALGG